MRLGVIGHQELPDADTWHWAVDRMREVMTELGPPHTGYSSLAVGTDQLFAIVVLQQGGALHAVVPFAGYEWKFARGPLRDRYHELLRHAAHTEVLRGGMREEEAAMQRAGERVVDLCEALVAVWNGKDGGPGTASEVVRYARAAGKPVYLVDPVRMTAGWMDGAAPAAPPRVEAAPHA